jgi:flagellar motor protein MotB
VEDAKDRVVEVRKEMGDCPNNAEAVSKLEEKVRILEAEVLRLESENRRFKEEGRISREDASSLQEEIGRLREQIVSLQSDVQLAREKVVAVQMPRAVSVAIAQNLTLAPFFFLSGHAEIPVANASLPGQPPVLRNPQLDRLIEQLNDNPSTRLRIHGHSNEKGAADFNNWLARRRAEIVLDYLKFHGIAKDRLEAVGHGSDDPLLSDSSQKANRRVDFEVIQL